LSIIYNILIMISELIFLFRLSYIVLNELFLFLIFRDVYSCVDRLTSSLVKLNILYVKIFQAIALNNNFINSKVNDKLTDFTNKAPYTPDDIDYDTLNNIEASYDLEFRDGYIPINSGMISLVFKVFKDDKPMIVKIKRIDIHAQLERAITNLVFLVQVLSVIPIIRSFQLTETIHNNIDSIRQQLNFTDEVTNIQTAKTNCKSLKYVLIPNVDEEVTASYPNVILMEFMNGITIDQIPDEDYHFYAKQVIKFGLVTTLIHGFTHGDLHRGNILFIKDCDDDKHKYKICPIDWGIVYGIDGKFRNLLFELSVEMFNTPTEDFARKIIMNGLIEPQEVLDKLPQHHLDNIIQFTVVLLNEGLHSKSQFNQRYIFNFLKQLSCYLNKHHILQLGIKPSKNFVKAQLVIAMAIGVTVSLCKNDNLMETIDTSLNELFHINLIEEE